MAVIGLGGFGPRHPWGNGSVIPDPQAAMADQNYGKIDLTDLIAIPYKFRYGERLVQQRDASGRPEYVIMPEPPPRAGGGTYATNEDMGAYPTSDNFGEFVKQRIPQISRYPVGFADGPVEYTDESGTTYTAPGCENGRGIRIDGRLPGREIVEVYSHEDFAMELHEEYGAAFNHMDPAWHKFIIDVTPSKAAKLEKQLFQEFQQFQQFQ